MKLCFRYINLPDECDTSYNPNKDNPVYFSKEDKWLINEEIKIEESIPIEGNVALPYTLVQKKGVLSTGELTKKGGRRIKI